MKSAAKPWINCSCRRRFSSHGSLVLRSFWTSAVLSSKGKEAVSERRCFMGGLWFGRCAAPLPLRKVRPIEGLSERNGKFRADGSSREHTSFILKPRMAPSQGRQPRGRAFTGEEGLGLPLSPRSWKVSGMSRAGVISVRYFLVMRDVNPIPLSLLSVAHLWELSPFALLPSWKKATGYQRGDPQQRVAALLLLWVPDLQSQPLRWWRLREKRVCQGN